MRQAHAFEVSPTSTKRPHDHKVNQDLTQGLVSRRAPSPLAIGVDAGDDPNAAQDTHVVYSLTVVIPSHYNPDAQGKRRPIEKKKLDRTTDEMKLWFGGFTSHRGKGGCRNKLTGEECADRSIVFTIDARPEELDVDRLREWRSSLEARFAQDRIHMTLLGPGLQI